MLKHIDCTFGQERSVRRLERRRERRQVKRIVEWRWNEMDDCREFKVVFMADGKDKCQAKWLDEGTLVKFAGGKLSEFLLMNGLLKEETESGELEYSKIIQSDSEYLTIKLDTLNIKIDLPTYTSLETSQSYQEQ